MKTSTKITLAISGVTLLGTAAYFLIKKYRNNTPTNPYINNPNYSIPKNSNNVSSGGDSFPLKMGSKGGRVKALQTYMNINRNSKAKSSEWGFKGCKPLLDVDGNWGPLTQTCFTNLRKVYSPEITKSFYDSHIKSYE